MKRITATASLLGVLWGVLVCSCTSAVKKTDTKSGSPDGGSSTQHGTYQKMVWKVTYTIGRDVHEINSAALASDPSPEAREFVDHELIDSHPMNAHENQKIVDRLLGFVQDHSKATVIAACHSPYKVVLELEQNRYEVKGCRSGPAASQISRLVREIEFLVYSKN